MIRSSTLFLRAAVLAVGLGVATLGVLFFPSLWHVHDEFPAYMYAIYVVLITIYITTIPYFIGLFNAWGLLNLIDKNHAFTMDAVRKLKIMALSAAIISGLYGITLPFFYIWADGDDAPGLVVMGMILTGVPMVTAVAMSLLARLLADAIKIKDENDLTV